MATVKPGETVSPTICKEVKKGVTFQTFRLENDNILREYAPPRTSGLRGKLPLASRKITYIQSLLSNGLDVCDQPNFCLPNNLLSIRLRQGVGCPWFDGHRKINIQVLVDYSEAVNPTFPNDADTATFNDVWTYGAPFEKTYQSNEVVGRFDTFEASPGFSTASVKIEEIRTNPTNLAEIPILRGTFTLIDGTYDTLAGQTVVEVINKSCENSGVSGDQGFLYRPDGTGAAYFPFWTMEWFPHGVVGLIRGLSLTVKANGWGD